jgi:hypothetical protein
MDIFDYTDDIEFLRDFYHLQGKNIDWAIIEVCHPEGKLDINPMRINRKYPNSEFKPGLIIEGSRVYVDLYERKFQIPVVLGSSSRKAHPAELKSGGNDSEYAALVAKEDPSMQIILPSSFVRDIHRQCWYGEWMEEPGMMGI